jgi:predicted nuclease with TOPRIM domain
VEVKDLRREQMLAELVAERDAMVMDLNNQVTQCHAQIEQLQREKEALATENEAHKARIACIESL